MKLPVTLLCLFAVLILCLPLAAVDGTVVRSAPSAAEQAIAPAGQAAQSGKPAPSAPKAEVSVGREDVQTQEPTVVPLEFELPDEFRILNTATGKVQRVKREDYVRGAVCAEMPPSFHTEALKAQAVAAHTYALRWYYNQQQNPDPSLKGADFAADPDNWRGYVTQAQAKERFGDKFDEYWGKLSAAADEGAKYVLVYDGEPIVAAYHSISAGSTEAASNVWPGDAPYLVPVESFGDTLAPNYETTMRFTEQEARALLTAADPAVSLGQDASEWLFVLSRSESGYALEVEAGSVTFTGQEIRNVFGLRSSDFDVWYEDGAIVFTVRGYGHGVGLSQYGADYMARQGATFAEILEHYYTGCRLET